MHYIKFKGYGASKTHKKVLSGGEAGIWDGVILTR
jgi:hypothetical protein